MPLLTEEEIQQAAPRSAKDERLAADVGALLGPDNLKRIRVEGQTAGRESSTGQATGLAVQQGTLRNFGDELGGYGAASGLPVGTPPVISAPVGAVRMLLGDKDADQRYGETAERLRGYYEGAGEAHPVATTLGEMGGGLAGPVGSGVASNIALGALDAGIAGAGAGEDAGSRALGAGTGAAVGGALTGALGASQRVLSNIYGRIMPSARNVEGQAADAVTKAISDSAPAPGTQARLDRARMRGQPTMAADIGEATARAAQTAANVSPEADRMIRDRVRPRFENQAERARGWWDSVTGGGSTIDTQEALRTQARRENRPRYEAAYARGESVWDDELQQLTTSPTVQAAMRDVTRTSADEAALQGHRVAVKNPFREVDGVMALPEGQSPNLEFWDHVQRNLRAQEEAAMRSSPTEGVRIRNLRNQLNERLDARVPEFGEARRVARGFFASDDALEAGRDFLNIPVRGGHEAERRAFNTLSSADQELFRHGVTENIRQRMAATTDNQEIGRMFNSPEMRDRLRLVLGPERTAQLQEYLGVERTMSVLKNMLGNSTTARQTADMAKLSAGGGLAGAVGGYMAGEDVGTTGGGFGGGTAAGFLASMLTGRVDERVARRMATMLTSSDPEVLRQGVEILRRNRHLRGVWDDVTQRIASVAGQQAGGAAGEQPMVLRVKPSGYEGQR